MIFASQESTFTSGCSAAVDGIVFAASPPAHDVRLLSGTGRERRSQASRSIREQTAYLTLLQKAARDAAENPFAQSRMPIGARDDQISAFLPGFVSQLV
jgi:hypothetical protein